MNLEELLDEMQNEMHSAHENIEKFTGGNKSAGTRVRKSMQSIKSMAQAEQKQAEMNFEMKLKEMDAQSKLQVAQETNKGKIAVANIQADLEADIVTDKLKSVLQKESVEAEFKEKLENNRMKHEASEAEKDRALKEKEMREKPKINNK